MTITAARLYSRDASIRSDEKAEELEREFFSMIRSNGKVNKTTWGGRLADVDELLEDYLKQTGLSPTQYLDVGVSSGIITRDWCRRLDRSGRPYKMVATDLLFRAFLVPVGPGLKVLSDSRGGALQYDFFGYGIRSGRPRPRDWVNGVAAISALMRLLYRRRLNQFDLVAGPNQSCDFSIAFKSTSDVRAIQLISPRIRGTEEISFIEDDLFSPAPDEMRARFHVIRVANLLNHDYFDSDSMLTICRRLKECMSKPPSLLIVCRTMPAGSNHGTIFRLSEENALIPVKRIGEGSEIESTVTRA